MMKNINDFACDVLAIVQHLDEDDAKEYAQLYLRAIRRALAEDAELDEQVFYQTVSEVDYRFR
jgi:hypothetical protein